MNLKYAVIGTGALGGYYGGCLAKNNKDVHFLFHSDYEFVKQNGLKVDSVNGDFHLQKINAYSSTLEMPVCDVVLVCLKTNNNEQLEEMLPPILHSESVVLLIQNGIDIEKKLATTFPLLTIAGGMAFICSSKIGKGHIRHMDFGSLNIGLFQGEGKEILKQIATDFQSAGVATEVAENLENARWKKLIWNIPYNGMTVVLNTTTDQLMKNPSSRKLIRALMQEVIEAARACKQDIKDEFADKMMVSTDKMTPYAPSMKLDFEAKRPMEIEAIYSNAIKKAESAGCEMKKVKMLEQQLCFIQDTYLPKR